MAVDSTRAIRRWSLPFLQQNVDQDTRERRALIILNQPFSQELLSRVWAACQWRCCADGGANRLFDALGEVHTNGNVNGLKFGRRLDFIPDLIKGDLDSLREDVKTYYELLGVTVNRDPDQNSTDLMKCVAEIKALDRLLPDEDEYTIIILGGLSGRLDQTVHTLSYVHRLRKERRRVFVVTDENIGWVLDKGEHIIEVDRSLIGPTCGLLPVGVESSILSTRGLKWDLTNYESSFDGPISTSNAVVDEEVYISTSKPIWWSVELVCP